ANASTPAPALLAEARQTGFARTRGSFPEPVPRLQHPAVPVADFAQCYFAGHCLLVEPSCDPARDCEELVLSPQLGNILRHELIHTLRCDYLWAMLGDVLCAVLFFHPAVREARKRLMMQRELACDLSVVESHPEQRADYAESLAQFVRLLMLRPSPALGVDFASSSSFLGTRIRHILTEPRQVPRWKKLISDAAFLLFIVIFGSVSPALSVSFNFSQQPPSQSVATPPSTRTTPLDFNMVSPRRRHNRVTLPAEYQQIITMSSLPKRARRH
ncbi:MAG TPA: M56 family metallopeptidase, partial [Candidatus Angelobacter sp.]|nr:M56 family metallopeptidase [Candidatus Angelobacter sp.]